VAGGGGGPAPLLVTAARPAADTVRVLIIDDNPSFADLLSAALDTVEDIECLGIASSAVEGLRRVAELRPSVVVMDIVMPGLDGLAATQQLRQLSPETAVAVVSAYAEGDWIARAEEAGASAYIPKGGSLDEMIAVIRSARPGPITVAPSLRALWSCWQHSLPDSPSGPDAALALVTTGVGRGKRHGMLSRLRRA
jgi:DNA-binding NarL/FixJ family response regulator